MSAQRVLAAILVAFALVPAATQAQGRPDAKVCTACHLKQKEARLLDPAKEFAEDVHAAKGLNCLDCHGAADAAGAKNGGGFLAKPDRRDIPALCGRCHSNAAYMRKFNPSLRVDQVTEYNASAHGRGLLANDPDVATCVNCHPAHRIRPASDAQSSVAPANVASTCGACHAKPWMRGHELPVDQLELYRTSVHGRLLMEEGDASAPTCNDCHGNHGAAPPGVESVRNVCGQCHSTIAEFFDESGHEEVFAERGLPGCATCHGNHDIQAPDDAALGLRNELVCGRCHRAEDANGNEFLRMQALFDSLRHDYDRSRAVLEQAENSGMEVSQALFELEDAEDALVRARAAIHAFRLQPVRDEIAAGLAVTGKAHERGSAALEEHRYRRVGLAVSTSLILILVLGLVFRIRDLDQRSAAREERP